jgi:hypothetical protein
MTPFKGACLTVQARWVFAANWRDGARGAWIEPGTDILPELLLGADDPCLRRVSVMILLSPRLRCSCC